MSIFNIFKKKEEKKTIEVTRYTIHIRHMFDGNDDWDDIENCLAIEYEKKKDRDKDFETLIKAIKKKSRCCRLTDTMITTIKDIQLTRKEEYTTWEEVKDKKKKS